MKSAPSADLTWLKALVHLLLLPARNRSARSLLTKLKTKRYSDSEHVLKSKDENIFRWEQKKPINIIG